jgi:hypothetical protein
MKETNRSGYEIRLDVLKLAEGIEGTRYARSYDRAFMAAEKANQPMEVPSDKALVEETLSTAGKLYAFVAEKGE